MKKLVGGPLFEHNYDNCFLSLYLQKICNCLLSYKLVVLKPKLWSYIIIIAASSDYLYNNMLVCV